MRTLTTLLLVIGASACGHGPGDALGQSDGGGNGRGDSGGGYRDANGGSDASGSLGPDGGSSGPDGGALGPDGGATSTHPLTELGTVSCWSVGGFQAVYHDQPAHIVGTLSDGDGIGDIDTTADVTIIGHYGALYAVGPRPLISLGDSGCCVTSVKVPIYYDDFVAAGQAVGAPDTEFWSAYATFRDHGGSTIVARCDDQWFLDDAYYGN
jgi:hypothetical protein